jgi:hypothetical protein|tara:strand:+ start:2444 stop:2614 length:171 start_codon:yes stop_codon:yes gene_type:complete
MVTVFVPMALVALVTMPFLVVLLMLPTVFVSVVSLVFPAMLAIPVAVVCIRIAVPG